MANEKPNTPPPPPPPVNQDVTAGNPATRPNQVVSISKPQAPSNRPTTNNKK